MKNELTSSDMTLLMPDERWFDAPAECTVAFYESFAPVARALQNTLRDNLNQALLTDPDRYEDGMAYPMVVYTATRHYRSATKTDFCHDVLNKDHMDRIFRSINRPLARVLEQTSAALEEAGRSEAAGFYHPNRATKVLHAVRTQIEYRRYFNQLIAIEGRLFNELVALCAGGRVPGKARHKQIAIFNKRWSMLLRQLYGSHDFSGLASKLLDAATAAYLSTYTRHRRSFEPAPFDCAA